MSSASRTDSLGAWYEPRGWMLLAGTFVLIGVVTVVAVNSSGPLREALPAVALVAGTDQPQSTGKPQPRKTAAGTSFQGQSTRNPQSPANSQPTLQLAATSPPVSAGPDLAKPRLRWKYRDAEPAAILTSPAVGESRLYLGCENGTLYCLDTEDGDVVWRINVDWEVASSPLVVGDRVYFGEGLRGAENVRFRCVSAADGKEVWNFPIAGYVESDPVLTQGRLYVTGGPAGVMCIDASTGKLLWRYGARTALGSPVVAGGRIYAGSTAPSLLCLDAATGKQVWEYRSTLPVAGRISTRGSRVYFGVTNGSMEDLAAKPLGTAVCVDTTTGKQVWSAPLKQSIFTGVTLAGNLAIYGARDGKLYARDAATGKQVWASKTGGALFGPPTCTAAKLYLGASDGRVRCFSLADGKQTWAWDYGSLTPERDSIFVGSATLSAGRLYLASTNGTIACLESE